MKRFIFISLSLVVVSFFALNANAQMMGSSNSSADLDEVIEHTLREEKEGKELWDKFQAKEVVCADLSDENFGALGEYFMGQMAGEQHATMNAMMMQMMGEEGEKQMHVAMGKRMSSCEPDAPMPQTMMGGGMMPMMQMMTGGGMMGGSNSMMGRWGGIDSWFISLLWLVWLIVGILAAVWLWKQIIKK